MLKSLSIFIILNIWQHSFAQSSVLIDVVFHNETIQLNKLINCNTTDAIIFTNFKFYITLQAPKNRKQYFLVDLENPQSMTMNLSNIFIGDSLHFLLGIDSLKQTKGVSSGALDPILGMYWTWQSGYIYLKAEGYMFRGNNKEEFIYHLGGFLHPYNAIHAINLPIKHNSEVRIDVNLGKWIEYILQSPKKQIMSPSEESNYLLKIIADSFYVVE